MPSTAKSLQNSVNNALTNKYVLYVVTFLAVTNILGYLAVQNFTAVTFFLLVGFLTHYFSKNMTIILLTAMIATSFLFLAQNNKYNYQSRMIQEGMKGQIDTTKSDANQKAKKDMSSSQNSNNEKFTIDKPGTNKQAFQSLQDMLGKEGVNNLKGDTQELLQRQSELKESMESLKPMMDTANSMLNSLDLESMDKITSMLDKFGGMVKKKN
tara:strand:+ start:79 stop:711 length:633 start_codon:yes stop_codon:yes gene_type:complete